MQTSLYGKIKKGEVNGKLERTDKMYLTFQLQEHNTRKDKGALGAY